MFAAGAALALLDAALRADPPAAGALRARLALQSAAASAKMLRLNTDAAALRDLRFAVGDSLGPAANLVSLWRDCAGRPPSLDADRLAAAAGRLDLALPDPNGLASNLKACAGEGDPVSAAASAFSVFPDAPAADAEILALSLFDLAIAIRLRWPRPVPLIAVKILDPTLRSPSAGRRPRPGTQPGRTPPQARSRWPPPRLADHVVRWHDAGNSEMAQVDAEVRSLKWKLRQGQTDWALDQLETMTSEFVKLRERGNLSATRLLHLAHPLLTCVRSNKSAIINYGARYRSGRRIATALADSAVNSLVARRMVKKQQMQWSKRARLFCFRFGPPFSTAIFRSASRTSRRTHRSRIAWMFEPTPPLLKTA